MHHGRSQRRSEYSIVIALLLVGSAATALPAQTTVRPTTPRPAVAGEPTTPAQRLRAAYALSSRAKTNDELSQIIEHCELALSEAQGETATYARELASWAYNRRGELYASEAAELVTGGEERRANELDNLALEDFQSAVAHNPARYQAIHNRAVSYVLFGKLDEALADLNKVLELAPTHKSAHFNRGEVLKRLGRIEDAASDYTAAINAKTGDVQALIARGETYVMLSRFREAIGDFNQALRFDPTNVIALTMRGEVHTRQGEWQAALDDYSAAIKQPTSDLRPFRGIAWLLATCPDEKIRNAELALLTVKKVTAADETMNVPSSVATLDTLAAAQAAGGDFEAAVTTQKAAIEAAAGTDVRVLENRLVLYEQSRPYRMLSPAVDPLDSTVESAPPSPVTSEAPVTTPPTPVPDDSQE